MHACIPISPDRRWPTNCPDLMSSIAEQVAGPGGQATRASLSDRVRPPTLTPGGRGGACSSVLLVCHGLLMAVEACRVLQTHPVVKILTQLQTNRRGVSGTCLRARDEAEGNAR